MLLRTGLLLTLLAAAAAASALPPTTLHAEATGTVAIGCEFLFSPIDGDPNDFVDFFDFVEACDGIDATDVANLANALGDEDDILEAPDFANVDVDANQIQDAGAGILDEIYVFAFVDDDGTVTFDAFAGVFVTVDDDGGADEAAPPEDLNSETCDGDDDADCGTSTLANGDGVVVATVGDGTADAGDNIDVDVFQADNASALYLETIAITGLPDEIGIDTPCFCFPSPPQDSVLQISAYPSDCGYGADVTQIAQWAEPERLFVQARVYDSDGIALARVPVTFDTVDHAMAFVPSDSGEAASDPKASTGVSIDFGAGTLAARALLCGGVETGQVSITAGIDPNGIPGDIDDEQASVSITVVGPPATIELQASPAQFVCDGVNTSTITATVRDTDGSLVADGVRVNFSVVSVGIVNPINTTTQDGVATTTFTGFSGFSVGVPVIVTAGDAQSSTLIQCIGFDTDGDGMPNVFEAAHVCLNQAVADSTGDPDADSATSFTEYQLAIDPCNPDTDADGCNDGAELSPNPQSGGDRDPLDAWDFYDVTGDRAIDLQDALAILSKFGLQPVQPGYDATFDRVAPDPQKPYRTAQAAGQALGIDLQDALLNLQSFGHSCAS